MRRLFFFLVLLFTACTVRASVDPLITTMWRNFMWPYNAYYPLNSEGPNGHEGNSCGHTSLSHILKYWEFPVNGTGSDSWTENGTDHHFEADFGATTYLWENMPRHIAWEATEDQYAATATLVYHAATSTHDIYRTGRQLHELGESLADHFGFADDYYTLNSWELTSEEWADTLRYELDQGRPILIAGRTEDSPAPWEPGNFAGHYYLVDGYNDDGEFHLVYGYGDFDYYYAPGEFGEHPAYNIALMNLHPDFSAGSRPQLTAETDPASGVVTLTISHEGGAVPESWTIRRDGEVAGTTTEPLFRDTLNVVSEHNYLAIAHFSEGDIGSHMVHVEYIPGPAPFDLISPEDGSEVSLPVTLSWSPSIATASALPSSIRNDRTTDDEGGPDGFGYRWSDSNESDDPVYEWVDILEEGETGPSNGTPEVTVDLPFDFPYYGNVYSEVTLSLHGLMWFEEAENFMWGSRIPSAPGPSAMIAPWWNMLNCGDGAEVVYRAEENRFIVEWSHVNHYASWNAWFTFEAILTPDGNILFQYQSMEQRLDDATVGIEDPSESDGCEVVFRDGSYMEDELAIFFQHPHAATYTLEWSTDPDFASSTTISLPYLTYTFDEPDLGGETVYWRVSCENGSGVVTWANGSDEPWEFTVQTSDLEDATASLPGTFTLEAPWPNPFNASTTIAVALPRSERVTLDVIDLLGRQVTTLHQGQLSAGRQTFTLSSASLPSGVYLLRASTQRGVQRARKLVVLK